MRSPERAIASLTCRIYKQALSSPVSRDARGNFRHENAISALAASTGEAVQVAMGLFCPQSEIVAPAPTPFGLAANQMLQRLISAGKPTVAENATLATNDPPTALGVLAFHIGQMGYRLEQAPSVPDMRALFRQAENFSNQTFVPLNVALPNYPSVSPFKAAMELRGPITEILHQSRLEKNCRSGRWVLCALATAFAMHEAKDTLHHVTAMKIAFTTLLATAETPPLTRSDMTRAQHPVFTQGLGSR